MKDIARETGYSVAAVSLALSGKSSRLSDETKKAILETAGKHGYRHNYLAQGLVTKKTKVLGVIVPDVSSSFFARITKGIGFEAEKHGYDIMLVDTGNNPDKDVMAARTLLERSVDGILYIYSPSGKRDHARMCISLCEEEGIPIVLMDRTPDTQFANVVMLDHELGGYLAGKHLIDLGHRRIGCAANSLVTDPAHLRFEGYKKALKEAGIKFDKSICLEGGFRGHYENVDTRAGYELAGRLIDKNVTAIFAFNDITAFGIYRFAREFGLKVPDDFSLIGFDDIYFSEIMEVPLTTIRQPSGSIGIASVKRMMKLLNQDDSIDEGPIILEPKLIVRKSTRGIKA